MAPQPEQLLLADLMRARGEAVPGHRVLAQVTERLLGPRLELQQPLHLPNPTDAFPLVACLKRLRAMAAALITYDPFPLEQEKRRLLATLKR